MFPVVSAAGLPIGMQLIANVLDEATLLQVAHQYEQAADVMSSHQKAKWFPNLRISFLKAQTYR